LPQPAIGSGELDTVVRTVADGWAWRAMKWAWRDYRVARLFRNEAKMMEAAVRIRILQEEAGVRETEFEELNVAWPPGPRGE
jgi:hypothetical protein